MTGEFPYTIGASTSGNNWYIRMPWHLRGSVAELIDQMKTVSELPDGCFGVEYWDGHVQFQRHRFPWIADD